MSTIRNNGVLHKKLMTVPFFPTWWGCSAWNWITILSSVRPSSLVRNSKILALCSLFLSAVSVTPIADTDSITHGEQEPAIRIGSPGFTTKFILSSGFPRAAAVHEHSFFRNCSEKALAPKLLCMSMKGILMTMLEWSLLRRLDTWGTSQVSYLMAPRSSPEPEVVPDAPFWRASQVSYFARRSEERGGISEERGARKHERSLHGSLLPADTPPYWISVIDCTPHLIWLIWYIIAVSYRSGDRL